MYYCPMYSQELIKGTLKTIVLSLLSEHDRMYGYEITQHVKDKTAGEIQLTEGAPLSYPPQIGSRRISNYRKSKYWKART